MTTYYAVSNKLGGRRHLASLQHRINPEKGNAEGTFETALY